MGYRRGEAAERSEQLLVTVPSISSYSSTSCVTAQSFDRMSATRTLYHATASAVTYMRPAQPV